MGLARKLRVAAGHPALAAHYAWSRISVAGVLAAYGRRARAAGLDGLRLIVSFDCDTEDDIEAATDVHARMLDMGIMPAYAVPGALLAEGASVYRAIAATGAEFLNHGDRRHMVFDVASGRHESCFFYDQEPRAEVEADIVGGDRRVSEIIGVKPRGFRTPHFGTFQSEGELRWLHALLARLGYAYSSSTTPGFGLCHGPVFARYGLPEIPVSGRGSRPFDILDSWSCFARPDRAIGPEDYRDEAIGLARRLGGGAGLINYYADPSHVEEEPIFFETMRELARLARPTTYRDLLALTSSPAS